MNSLPVLVSPFVEVTRNGRHLIARLKVPARVLSTSHVNGGLRGDITYLVNHQSCEPVKHQERFELIVGLGQEGYHGHVCTELGIPGETTVLMGTAAAMQYLGVVTHSHEDLSVTAIVTGGVTGNAGSAGDEASWDERDGKWLRTETPAPTKPAGTSNGTINTLLLLSSPLSDSGLTRASMTMTEAKTSALLELAVGSRSSWRLATGTGTDQFAIACPSSGGPLRTWTGKHTKAGELVGRAVREATLEALRWQNGLEPSYTRSIVHALGRFGLTEEKLREGARARLSALEYQLFCDNWNPVLYEPQLAAAGYALAAVLDRVLAGTLGTASARESLLNQAALMAVGLSTKPEAFTEFRSRLIPALPEAEAKQAALIESTVQLALAAIAQGWSAKWTPAA